MHSPVATTLRETALKANTSNMPMNSDNSTEKVHQSKFDLYPSCRWDEESTASCSTAVSWSESETNEPIVRKVRFAECSKSSIMVCRATVIYEPWTEGEMSAAWYNREEYEAFKVQCRQDMVAACQSEHHKNYMRMYYACGDESLESMAKKESVSKNGAQSALCVAASEFRGIEYHLYFGTMKRVRQDCVQSILDLQDECYTKETEVDDDERAAKLATLSLQNSRRTRRISYLIGFGDSIVARSA